MNWLDEMNTDALAIAAPDFELKPGDEIHIDMATNPGGWLSSVTFEPGYLRIVVAVWRPTKRGLTDCGPDGELIFGHTSTGKLYYHALHRCYLDTEAPEFFKALMQKGSERR